MGSFTLSAPFYTQYVVLHDLRYLVAKYGKSNDTITHELSMEGLSRACVFGLFSIK